MTAAQRKTRERARLRTLAEMSSPSHWDERVCLMILSNSKYSPERRQQAWIRFGQLNNWK